MDKRAPEFVVDQSLCYSPATNYYGYYCTGFEAPSEWDGHQRFFGLGGSDPHYAGMCVEDLPHVYYTPSYEFAHSPYNPYNPYVPGAILGVDGSFIGEQQYYAGSPYEHHTPSPTYYPLALQSKIDSIPTSVWEPRSLNTSVSSAIKLDRPGLKRPSSASVGIMKIPTQPSSGNVKSELADGAGYQTHSLPRISEAAVSKQPVVHTNITSSGAPATTPPLASQGKDVSGPTHASNQFSYERSPSLHAPLKVSLPVTNGSSNFDVIGVRPRSQYGEVSSNGKGSSDFLREQNRGPRTSKDKSQWTSTISVKAYTKTTTHNVEDDITINADQYNKEDFPVNYTDGKFFVIKSYSEDDVHKSIKYNVWSSTTNGNKRLDSAYEDAQRIAFERSRGCPIFLFFSVNASGQFCGVAEMIGPVDFHKDMDFWQHDKWNGSFPVKWHFLKDVPNNNFRHIILENNDNRPVTNSRDTQEIRYKQGMEMLHIFKNYPMKTSILDDFIYYEDRQKIMTEQKSRYLSKNYNRSFYAPAFALDKSNVLVDHSPSAGEKNPISPGDPNSPTHEQVPEEVHTKPNDNNSSSEVDNMKLNVVGDVDDASVSNTDSLTIDSQQAAEAKSSVAVASMVGTPVVDDIVTVGSMPIKVNGFTDASGSFKVGTIPIHLEGLKLDNSGMPTAGRSLL